MQRCAVVDGSHHRTNGFTDFLVCIGGVDHLQRYAVRSVMFTLQQHHLAPLRERVEQCLLTGAKALR